MDWAEQTPMSDDYPIANSTDEVARLRMQGDLYRDDTHQMLTDIGVRPGWRCLDLCAGVGGITDLLNHHVGNTGEVIGFEYDQEKIDVARGWAAANGYDRVTFMQGDGFATGLPPGSFDLVHSRFAMSIVPHGLGMLDHAIELTRPGGVLFLQEVELNSITCFPHHPAWDFALNALVGCFDKLGSDIRMGRKLNALLIERGLQVTHLRPCKHLLRAGEPMHYHVPLTFYAMRQSIVDLGICAQNDIRPTMDALMAHLSRPETSAISFTMVQAAACRPRA